jgi:hypothetical protein
VSSNTVSRRKRDPSASPPSGLRLTLPRRSLEQLTHVRVLWEPSTPSYDAVTTRITWGMVVVFGAAYAALFAWMSPLALQDFPNHLARVRVIADLLFEHGERFGSLFELHFHAIPYLLGDLILAAATQVLGVTGAAVFWSTLSFLSLPCALLFYLRTTQLRPDSRALLVLLSLYLATDWFFLVGFLEFRVGIALSLVILAVAERYREKQTIGRLLLYMGVLGAGYLTHLTTLVFVAALAGTIAGLRLLRRQSRLPVEALLVLPCLALLLWHFGFTGAYRAADDQVENDYIWGTVALKVGGVIHEFSRYSARPDHLMLLVLLAAVACQVGYYRRDDSWRPRAGLEFAVLALVMLAVYFILPMGYAEAFYVDVRALPFVSLFAILAVLSVAPANTVKSRVRPGLALALGALLVAGNLIYLASHMHGQKQWLAQYRSIIALTAPGSRVLPVYTHAPEGHVVPYLHAFAFASIDRDDVVPYLQTGDTGNPQKYLRYRNRPYAPDALWYGNLPPSPVDWASIACEYQFLLVTKPFNPARLAITTSVAAENNSATLLAVQRPSTCAAPPVARNFAP